ncbi:hypothetical protein CN074_21475 [Sinorhizobium medicae]|nr:hypothetical protein CN201_30050 [Sinorhizobium medicae]RVJ51746.1 hypothetical protein CN166_27065 [Sinorhizobium medicae]RVK19381.1 hypothetical protein CN165_12475 [Sinorhizobium medicae]RVP65808.1 hypothetical protein CN074_21475 [Sinorhizobium medicae]RVQ73609.1 hypothetical protein CN244_10520 [Sinorhizobium medicae]
MKEPLRPKDLVWLDSCDRHRNDVKEMVLPHRVSDACLHWNATAYDGPRWSDANFLSLTKSVYA